MADKIGTDGNDNLMGGLGNDTLDGGKGNDSLYGGRGNDTYIFNLGYGKDRISDVDATVGNIDTIKLGEGITETSIKLTQVGNDLVIGLGNGVDELKVVNYFTEDRYKIENITFSNGAVWDRGNIAAALAYSKDTEQEDYIGEKTYIIGTPNDEVLIPNNIDGDNYIDPLQGNDVMRGGKGNDTYIYGTGYGIDTIIDYDDTPGNVDTIRFINGLARQDLAFSKVGDDLKISIIGTKDILTVSHFFDPTGNYEIEKIIFGNGMVIEGVNQFRKELEDEFAKALAVRPTSDPVVLDLDGNGIEISTLEKGVNFDLDNNDFAEKIQWVNAEDGILARDLNGNGQIDNGSEVFGDQVRMSSGRISANGYEALKDLDRNRDYVLDSKDAAFKTLKIWIDKNSNGITDEGELKSLTELGINSLNLNDKIVDDSTPGVIKQKIGTWQDEAGNQLDMSQFFFNVDLSNTVDLKELPGVDDKLSSILNALPEIRTVGNVYGLRKSMATNEELRNLVAEFTLNKSANKQELLDKILLSWIGVTDVPRWTRGQMDARDLLVVESFIGRKFVGAAGPNVLEGAGDHLRRCYEIIKTYVFLNLTSQSYLKEYVTAVECNFNKVSMKMEYNFDKLKNLCIGKIGDSNFGYVLSDLLACYSSDPDAVKGIRTLLEQLRPMNEEAYIIATANKIYGRADGEFQFGQHWGPPAGWAALEGSNAIDYIYGGKGNDGLAGRAGDDRLEGEEGNDILYGNEGNDTLIGGLGNDTLDGGDGSDTYIFEKGSGKDIINNYDVNVSSIDVIKLGSGITADMTKFRRAMNDLEISIVGTNDVITITKYYIHDNYKVDKIVYEDGSFVDNNMLRDIPLYGTDGNDTLTASDNKETIYGLGGNDVINALAGDDTIDGGTGDDTLSGGAGSDIYIFGLGSGKDTINENDATSGNVDTIKFGAGISQENLLYRRVNRDLILTIKDTEDSITIKNYYLTKGKVEKIEFVDGSVLSNEILDNLIIYGTINDDIIDSDDVSEVIKGLEGADKINAYGGDDTINGNSGNDIIDAGSGNDTVWGDEGNDTINGNEGNDILDGGIGNDTLIGKDGDDTYIFGIGSGADIIIDTDTTIGNIDTVKLGEGITDDNIVYRRDMNSLEIAIKGTGDKFTIKDYYVSDSNKVEKIVFTDGHTLNNDVLRDLPLYGTEGNDEIKATDNKEEIYGLGGDDTIYAYDGDDTVYGGAGNDNINGGSGSDYLDSGLGNDRLNGGIGNDQYIFSRGYGQDTITDIDQTVGNRDTILLSEGISEDDLNVRRVLNNLELSINGTDDKLTIIGYYLDDSHIIETIKFANGVTLDNEKLKLLDLYGTEATDSIDAFDRKEVIRALAGNDIINANAGDDIIYAGAGNDRVNAGDGNDILYGEEGNDILQGGIGNDTLIGGIGNDTLDGGIGNDNYIFSRGYGQDTITDIDQTLGNVDTILLAEGISEDDLNVRRVLNNLELSIKGTDDKLIIIGYYVDGNHIIETIKFANGVTLDNEELKLLDLYGTEEAESVYGSNNKEVIRSLAGNDIINAYAGDDIVYAGAGDDRVDAGDGNDILDGGEGNDTLQGGNGNDTLIGGIGNDTLDGGAGKDLLEGSAGDDTYIFGIGSGEDTITEYDLTEGNCDIVKLGVGITKEKLKYGRFDKDLVITIDGTADKLTIKNYFEEGYKIEKIQLSDGTIVEIQNEIIVYGTEGDDVFIGENSNDTYIALGGNDAIYGNGGNDKLYGSDGNDILDGGAGSDYLEGGTGDDTYVFGIGYGEDTISESDPNTQNIDTLKFGEGITKEDLIISRNGYNLEISIKDHSDKVTILDYYTNNSNRIEKFMLFDGTIIDSKEADSLALYGTDQDDILKGGEVSEVIMALAGNDIIYGEGGNDLIDSGIGNDTMYGGSGNDTYIFQIGSGEDTIVEDDKTYGNIDVVKFGAGITSDKLKLMRLGNDLQITVEGATDKLTISNYYKNNSNKVERLELADGTIISADKYDTLALYGTNGNDLLQAGDCKDTIMALEGGDIIYGFGGEDIIHAAGGNDTLYGGTGNDALNGEDGDDILNGEEGNDILTGGAGNDSYVFELGCGIDTIDDYNSTGKDVDTIEFGENIDQNSVSFIRVGNDLQIIILGTNDRVNIKNYYNDDNYKIEVIKFKDGTIWNSQDIETLISRRTTVVGTDAVDKLRGNSSADIIMGEGGNDILDGNGGDDIIYGGAGDDTINGGDGNDTITGDEGNDVLKGASGNDTYVFKKGFGQDTISDSDIVKGNIDTIKFIDGIRKEDIEFIRTNTNLEIRIKGTEDSIKIMQQFVETNRIEKIVFEDGTVIGVDELNNIPMYGTSNGDNLYGDSNINIINALEGIDTVYAGGSDDIVYGGSDDDYLYGEDGNDTLYGEAGDDNLDGGQGTDTLYGGVDNDNLDGGQGDDVLYGGDGIDTIQGRDGNDILMGENGDDNLIDSEGNDILDGGTGDDNLDGGTGDDIYIFAKGYGKDTISDYDTTEGNIDTIKFGEGIDKESLSYKRVINSLEISFGNTEDNLTILDYFVPSNNIEVIKFKDDSILDNSVFNNLDIYGTEKKDIIYGDIQDNVIYGLGGADEIRGSLGNDTISCGEGDDFVYGEEGNDILDGGSGSDKLNGGSGDDTYVFGLGYGIDTIFNSGSLDGDIDKLLIKDVNYSDISITKVNADLLININGTTDSVTISSYFNGGEESVEIIQFKNGQTLNFEDVNNALTGSNTPMALTTYDTILEKSIEVVGELSDTGMVNTNITTNSTSATTDLLFNLNS